MGDDRFIVTRFLGMTGKGPERSGQAGKAQHERLLINWLGGLDACFGHTIVA